MNTKINYIVGWSTKQSNQHIRRTSNTFGEFEFQQALKKYLILSNRDRVIYCYLNIRKEYEDGSVEVKNLYHV